VASEEVIVPLTVPRDSVPLATHARGTMIATSLAVVRSLSLEEPYFRALPIARHDAVRALVASEWVPMDVAVDHYGALDSLKLPPRQIADMGRQTSIRIQGTYLRTLATTLRAAGAVDPVAILSRTQTLMDRSFLGATVAAWKTGPKDARVELLGIPALRFAYLRMGWMGAFEAGLELVARKVYVVEIEKQRTRTSAAFQVSWV
jgi:hypothetical protein